MSGRETNTSRSVSRFEALSASPGTTPRGDVCLSFTVPLFRPSVVMVAGRYPEHASVNISVIVTIVDDELRVSRLVCTKTKRLVFVAVSNTFSMAMLLMHSLSLVLFFIFYQLSIHAGATQGWGHCQD